MKKILLALVLALQAGLAHAAAGELTVSAAASLTNAFGDLKAVFEKDNPGLTCYTNFAASNPLLQQIVAGAPVDVFASADQETMDKAEAAGLILPGSRKNFAANTLVLIAPEKGGLQKGEDLPGVRRLAVGQPDSVPAGRYAQEALSKAGIWDNLRPVLVYGNTVRQVLDYVARGEVDAGIVYGSDVLTAPGKVRTLAVIEGHKPITYPIAVIRNAKNPEAAARFIELVLSPDGVLTLEKFGFSKP